MRIIQFVKHKCFSLSVSLRTGSKKNADQVVAIEITAGRYKWNMAADQLPDMAPYGTESASFIVADCSPNECVTAVHKSASPFLSTSVQ